VAIAMNRTQTVVTMIEPIFMTKFLARSVRYRTLDSPSCLLISLSSALGNALLNPPQNHASGISIPLLKSQPTLSISLLNESTKVPFFKALGTFFNRQGRNFLLTINTQTDQKRVAVSLLLTADFKYPKSAFSTIIM
jgi:hypothetical protein